MLYTEMITTGAIIYGDRPRHLDFDPFERPIALQIGGDDPQQCAEAVAIAEEWRYDEYNLNVGCPSERVRQGAFGACLMARPHHVADIVRAMKRRTRRPVTVKHRIGIDRYDRYEDMLNFARIVAEAGADRLIVHARIAKLHGFSPKQNRNIPPLRYADVHRLKRDMGDIPIEINGGIVDHRAIAEHLRYVDGVMIGRAAYSNPWLFADVDQRYFGAAEPSAVRDQVVQKMDEYLSRQSSRGYRHTRRHLFGLFYNQRNGRYWRRLLSDPASRSLSLGQIVEGMQYD